MGIFNRKDRGHLDPPVIDLRDQAPVPAAERIWGLPTRCPACHQPGYLDHIDPFREIMFQHCPSCFARWETSRAEIDAPATTS